MVEIFTKDLIIHTHTFRGSLLNKKKMLLYSSKLFSGTAKSLPATQGEGFSLHEC